jgi:hypothetical protein
METPSTATLHINVTKDFIKDVASGNVSEKKLNVNRYWAALLCGTAVYVGRNRGLMPKDWDTYWNRYTPTSFQHYETITFRNGDRVVVATFKDVRLDEGNQFFVVDFSVN